jgi:cell division control protein 24
MVTNYQMQDLRDKTNADDATKEELTAGMEASNRVLYQANAAVDRELRNEALQELCALVEDWKNHEVGQFGELLLHGQFTVVTGKSDQEKEVSLDQSVQHDLSVIPQDTQRF